MECLRFDSTNSSSSSGSAGIGGVPKRAMFSASRGLCVSLSMKNDAKTSRSTSFGEPSARALPRAVTTIGPIRPA